MVADQPARPVLQLTLAGTERAAWMTPWAVQPVAWPTLERWPLIALSPGLVTLADGFMARVPATATPVPPATAIAGDQRRTELADSAAVRGIYDGIQPADAAATNDIATAAHDQFMGNLAVQRKTIGTRSEVVRAGAQLFTNKILRP